VDRLREMGIGEDPGMNRIFWFMMKKGDRMVPGEQGNFLRIGTEKSIEDGRRDIKEELLGNGH